jgi:hypothetical protein
MHNSGKIVTGLCQILPRQHADIYFGRVTKPQALLLVLIAFTTGIDQRRSPAAALTMLAIQPK